MSNLSKLAFLRPGRIVKTAEMQQALANRIADLEIALLELAGKHEDLVRSEYSSTNKLHEQLEPVTKARRVLDARLP